VIEAKVNVGALSVKLQVTWPIITVPKGMAVIVGMIIIAVTPARLVVRRLNYVRPCSMYLSVFIRLNVVYRLWKVSVSVWEYGEFPVVEATDVCELPQGKVKISPLRFVNVNINEKTVSA